MPHFNLTPNELENQRALSGQAGTRDLQLQSGDPGTILAAGRNQAQQVGAAVPNFNVEIEKLRQFQQTGRTQGRAAQEEQFQRATGALPEDLAGKELSPSQIIGFKRGEAGAVEPTIRGARDLVQEAQNAIDRFQQTQVREEERLRDTILLAAQGGSIALEGLFRTNPKAFKAVGIDGESFIAGIKAQEQAAAFKASQTSTGTASQQKLAGFAVRMEQSIPILDNLEKTIQGMNIAKFTLQTNLPARFQNDDIQSYMQAARNFINATLRQESGAAIAPSEFTEARQQYLPLPGDSDEVLAQKKTTRNLVFTSFKSGSGPAFQSVDELLGLQEQTVIRDGATFRVNPDGSYTRIK